MSASSSPERGNERVPVPVKVPTDWCRFCVLILLAILGAEELGLWV